MGFNFEGRGGLISGASLLDLARLSAPRAPGTHQSAARQQRRCCMGGRGAPRTRNVFIWRLTATRACARAARVRGAHCLWTVVWELHWREEETHVLRADEKGRRLVFIVSNSVTHLPRARPHPLPPLPPKKQRVLLFRTLRTATASSRALTNEMTALKSSSWANILPAPACIDLCNS